MRSSLIYGADARRYCADARPRKRGVATIADAIGMRRFAFRLDALRHRQGKSAHSPSGLVTPPRHKRASSRHTKRHEITSCPIPATSPHSAKYADWLMGRYSKVRSFREISCRPKAAFVSDDATKPEGLLLRDVMGRAEGSRPYDDAQKQIAARRCRIVSVRGRA